MKILIHMLTIIGLFITPLFGQAQTAPAESGVAATQPAGVDQAFQAKVAKVSGKVSYALVDGAGQRGPWQDAKVGDTLPAGTQIRTQARSKVVLEFGDDTVVMIERITLASIDQFHRAADTKVVRLGLGHGAIRAGVAETTLRSDMTIETPTAILSKRGTQDFRMEYTPVTGRFRVSLAGEGLVEALNKLTSRTRSIGPGQYVTQAMIRWIETATFDRFVSMSDVFGMTGAEKSFLAFGGEGGQGAADPGGGAGVYGMTGQGGGLGGTPSFTPPSVSPLRPGAIDRPEGNFGTGAGGK